ncbi:MAG: nickel-dependent hydrogenase large subunit [Coriobacteriia bacterium]|nr:nickel-dependent hydrogenase large subunit [Coriobacteriia bacterium]
MTTYNLIAGTSEHEVDPISRIEGHLGVKVSVEGGLVKDANAHGNLWRGFENFVLGRKPNDPITYMQRICGVCPVPHGLTATFAADAVLGYSPGHTTFKGVITEKAMLIRNLVLGAEFLMSSITHFYHLAAPSYVQGPAIPPWTPYFNDACYSPLLLSAGNGVGGQGVVPNAAAPKLWDAIIISYVTALKMRRLTFEAGALFAGRMPMTSCFVAGGVTNDTSDLVAFAASCAKFKSLIRDVGLWIVKEYVPIAFALGLLYADYDNAGNTGISGDRLTPEDGKGYGAGLGRFLSWGCFPETDDTLFTRGGVSGPGITPFTAKNKAEVWSKWLNPASGFSVEGNLTEDIANSRYSKSAADIAANSYTGTEAYPGDVLRTKPNRGAGYSYIKAPLWDGKQCEVGPLARLKVAGIYAGNLAGLYGGIYALPGSAAYGLNPNALSATLVAGLIGTDTSAVIAGTNAAQLVAAWLLPEAALPPALQGIINPTGVVAGLSVMDRLRARALESLLLVQRMVGDVVVDPVTGALSWSDDWTDPLDGAHTLPCWIDQLAARGTQASWVAGSSVARKVGSHHGYGAVEAPRGALMHQSTIKDNKITAYQCIVPTTWNGAPKSAAGENGAIEKACIGVPFDNDAGEFLSKDGSTMVTSAGGIEVVRVAQTFDPCIACAVH